MNSHSDALKNFIQTEVVVDDSALDGGVIEVETDLLLTGAVDSLGVIRITHWMEEIAGVTVDPGDVTLENFQTVAKMLAYLDTQTNGDTQIEGDTQTNGDTQVSA